MGGAVFDLLFDLRPNYGSFSGSFTSKQAQVPPRRKKVETSFNPTSLWPPELFWLLVCTGLCSLQESVSPVLWKFCNQIPLAFNIFSGGSQSLCRILRLGNLLWVLELS